MDWLNIEKQCPKAYKKLNSFLERRDTMFRKITDIGYVPLVGEEDILNNFFFELHIVAFCGRRLIKHDTFSSIIITETVTSDVVTVSVRKQQHSQVDVWTHCFYYLEKQLN